jgi:hypothetical protein
VSGAYESLQSTCHHFGVGNLLPATMVISQEGHDLIKYVAQAAVVVPIIAGPA